jgi:hypothetical protein
MFVKELNVGVALVIDIALAEVTDPPGVTIVIHLFPVVIAGETKVIVVSFTTVYEVTAIPL